ncbi:MAG: MurI1: glutamate racemase [Pseudomonadota bacterium]|jgi:glutamate racemase
MGFLLQKKQYSHFMTVATPRVLPFPPQDAMPADPSLLGSIGVFDSGVGGLSVLGAIHDLLPDEDLVYVADSGHAPYGDKPAEHIVERTLAIGLWLAGQGVRAITVACNTATVTAVNELRRRTQVPVVAIEPAIKPATACTRTGVVGVLATQQTLHSQSVGRLVSRFGQGVRFVWQACPAWVGQVEQGDLEGAHTLAMVERDTRPLRASGADVWVLGCTHFPFLAGALRACAGPDVLLLDPARAVALELQRRLPPRLSLPRHPERRLSFLTTGPVDASQRVISKLWGYLPSLAQKMAPAPTLEA